MRVRQWTSRRRAPLSPSTLRNLARGGWSSSRRASVSAPYVRRFNVYAERDTGFARRRELPSPLATLVFNLGCDLRVEHPLGTSTTYRAGAAFYLA